MMVEMAIHSIFIDDPSLLKYNIKFTVMSM